MARIEARNQQNKDLLGAESTDQAKVQEGKYNSGNREYRIQATGNTEYSGDRECRIQAKQSVEIQVQAITDTAPPSI